jgi:hypothetical protein
VVVSIYGVGLDKGTGRRDGDAIDRDRLLWEQESPPVGMDTLWQLLIIVTPAHARCLAMTPS